MLFNSRLSASLAAASILLMVLVAPARAEVLVLVHGYMSSPDTWEKTHINELLVRDGWQRGGILIPAARRHIPDRRQTRNNSEAEKIFYMVELPWQYPLQAQADALDQAMQRILEMRPDDDINLAGHSAGAVVARLWLVQNPQPRVKRLISIAAPNLGTERADDALLLTRPVFGPFDSVRNLVGGKRYNTVRRSRPLVRDLTPPSRRNPTILYWLNRQPHPEIAYYSIVRESWKGKDSDWLIDADSQDLNNVPALRGKSESFIMPRNHELSVEDGHLLTSILDQD